MKDAPESYYNRCRGVFKPLAGGNAFCIHDSHGELKAAVTGEVVAQDTLLEETGAITAHPFWKWSQRVIVPQNKLEGAVSGSCGNGDDVPFQRAI